LLIGGAMVGTGLVVTDRRTTGIQVEDQSIELRAAARVRELATLGRVDVVSYNRSGLLSKRPWRRSRMFARWSTS
jgi:osmotically-inducible protein OsmY